jgi:hypothetical protein
VVLSVPGGENISESDVGNFTGLREAVHSFPDFDVDMTMMHEGSELVFSHDGLWNDGDGDPYIFVLVKWACLKKNRSDHQSW